MKIHYDWAAYGVCPDWGSNSGRDEEGRWELHFANEVKREAQLLRIFDALRTAATEAIVDHLDGANSDWVVWLKAIGAPCAGLPPTSGGITSAATTAGASLGPA